MSQTANYAIGPRELCRPRMNRSEKLSIPEDICGLATIIRVCGAPHPMIRPACGSSLTMETWISQVPRKSGADQKSCQEK